MFLQMMKNIKKLITHSVEYTKKHNPNFRKYTKKSVTEASLWPIVIDRHIIVQATWQ